MSDPSPVVGELFQISNSPANNCSWALSLNYLAVTSPLKHYSRGEIFQFKDKSSYNVC